MIHQFKSLIIFFGLAWILRQALGNELADLGKLALGHQLNGFGAVFGDGGVDAVPNHQRQNGVLGEGLMGDERGGEWPAVFVGKLLQGAGEVELHKASLVLGGHFDEALLGFLGERPLIDE